MEEKIVNTTKIRKLQYHVMRAERYTLLQTIVHVKIQLRRRSEEN